MTPSEASDMYENIVIRAILTNDNNLWSEAHALSCTYSFSSQVIETCHASVERWLRLHGITKMDDHERSALITIQSAVRRWFVQRALKQQYEMYSRLAKFDSPDHCKKAFALQKTLACAWENIQRR